ncbi:MAG: NAD(+)/NADH kinase [Simkaniaceae bacterium]|nr:NAD(+)/NADH kinase [Simkaniaceae bacterium]
MIVALLVAYAIEKKAHETIHRILDFFHIHKVHVVIEDAYAKELNCPSLSSIPSSSIDFLISLGGDGTILSYAHAYRDLNVPLLGINIGHLGFMADIPLTDIEKSLEDLLRGEYVIEKRLILYASNETYSSYAINDIVIHRAMNPSLIEVSIHVDGLYLNTFEADGIILATPNGSTAYSLAAGGPILVPELEAIVLTPICPHTISNRPLVLSSDATIEIKYLSPSKPIECVADGMANHELKPNDSITIKKSDKIFKLVTLNRRDFYSTLRSKLGWSGKLR